MCADVDPDAAELFVADMNEMPIPQLIEQAIPAEMKTLDRKLFKALIESVKPKEHDEHLKDIQGKVKTGMGRHAVRVLDEAYEYESLTVAVTAAGEIVNSEVNDVAHMGKYITGFRLHVQEMDNSGHSLPGLFVLEMVRKATLGLKDPRVQATIAEFESKPKSEQTAKILLESLFRVYTAWKRRQGLKTKFASVLKAAAAQRKKQLGQANAAVGGNDGLVDQSGKPLCNYCGKGNHQWKACRKRLDDEKKGVNKPMHVPKGVKTKAKAKALASKSEGKCPPCPICKKTNHTQDKCFFRKKHEEQLQQPNAQPNGIPQLPPAGAAVVPAGGAIVAGSGVGNLLEQMLAQKLTEKLAP